MDDNLYRNQPDRDPQWWDTHEMAALPSPAAPVAEAPARRTRTRFTVAAGVAAAALIGGGMWMGAAYADGPSTPTSTTADGSTAPSDGTTGTTCGCATPPAPPADGQAPTPPKAGEAPTPPKDGAAPAAPKEGDAPAAPKEGDAPAAPKEGAAPAAPKAGEAPAAPAPPTGGADCAPAPAPSAAPSTSGS